MLSLHSTFDSIAYCVNVDRCLAGDAAHPCSKIVLSQQVPRKRFQLPEPWRGQIDKAPILFLGSNPSIGDDEYALLSSPKEQVWESEHLAFGGGTRAYIADGIKTTKPDGTAGRRVQYWTSIRARARELIPGAKPGEDYAITEVVHCKSRGEIGVQEAVQTCYHVHMGNVFAVSPAEVVVALGKVAQVALLSDRENSPGSPCKMRLGDKDRIVFFLPHPNRTGPKKSLAAHYSSEALNMARLLINQKRPERGSQR
ncbi:MAG: hypothetical protein JO311_04470 [Candidatus Eremiobacteraeota bacterium]|nr:hypothetical protein [Candidatus Eremiobacteraeota bacterium]MBV9263911.1 hypothetical protein [Candidatus Eremiobacteraeota bacterium]